eukprot:5614727-Amphidinium_carterae.2
MFCFRSLWDEKKARASQSGPMKGALLSLYESPYDVRRATVPFPPVLSPPRGVIELERRHVGCVDDRVLVRDNAGHVLLSDA